MTNIGGSITTYLTVLLHAERDSGCAAVLVTESELKRQHKVFHVCWKIYRDLSPRELTSMLHLTCQVYKNREGVGHN